MLIIKYERSGILKSVGILNLKHDNDDYIMFVNGRSYNITETLDLLLLSDVQVSVKKAYDGTVLFAESGRLIKEKAGKCLYLYHVDGKDLDQVLWDNVGNKLEVDIKNITKC